MEEMKINRVAYANRDPLSTISLKNRLKHTGQTATVISISTRDRYDKGQTRSTTYECWEGPH